MAYRLSIFLLTLIGIVSLAASTAYVYASGLDDIQKGTLMLYNGGGGFCSGTLIAPDLILSAAHCAEGGENTNVRVQILNEKEEVLSEKLVYVKAVRTLKAWDVALFSPKGDQDFIEAFGSAVAVIDVASDDEAKAVKLGDRVIAFGYPKAFQLQVTDGLMSGLKFLNGMGYEHPVYKISTPITGGNSGGGLYASVCADVGPTGQTVHTCTYKLLGVNVAGFRDVAFMNYSATHEAVMAVTQGFVSAKFKEQAQLDRPGEGIDSK